MRRKLIAVGAGISAALTIGAATASADPTNNPNALHFEVTCPGMAPFEVTVVGAPGFVNGERLLTLRRPPGQGQGLSLVECTAFNEQVGSFTVFLQFVQRGG